MKGEDLKEKMNKLHLPIRRPLMWVALLISFAYVLYANILLDNTDFDIVKTKEINGEAFYEGRPAGTIEGKVYKVERKNDKVNVYLKQVKIVTYNDSLEEVWRVKDDNFLFRNTGVICSFDEADYGTKNISPGKIMLVYGRFNLYDKATNPGQFDLRKYYLSKDVLFRIDKCEIREVSGQANIVQCLLNSIRDKCEKSLEEALSDEDAGIMKAIMFADKTDMDSELKDMYSAAGAGHLLAISGLHISLIGMGLMGILKRTPLPEKLSISLVVGILILYAIMIGFTPSSNRAIIMFIIMMFGKIRQKTYDGLTALSVALLITVVMHPLSSLQSGFYMTYLAIIGLSIVSGVFKPFKKNANKMLRGLMASVSVSMATLPVVINSYYSIPTYSIVMNVILVPGMSVVLILGVLTIIWQMLIPLKVNICGFSLHVILKLYSLIIGLCLKLPFSVVITGHRSEVKVWIYTGVLLGVSIIAVMVKRKAWIKSKALKNIQRSANNKESEYIESMEKKKYKIKMLLIYMLLFCNIAFFMIPEKYKQIEFLDVGQGLCSVVQYKGHVFVFDGGSSSKENIYQYIILPYLKYYGVKKIDAVFISHADLDHTSGLEELIAKNDFKVKNIYFAKALERSIQEKIIKDNLVNDIQQGGMIKSNDLQSGEMIKSKDLQSENLKKCKGLQSGDMKKYKGLQSGDIIKYKDFEWVVLSPEWADYGNSKCNDSELEYDYGNSKYNDSGQEYDGWNLAYYEGYEYNTDALEYDYAELDENANSLVMLLNTKEGKALFMADAGNMAEEKVLEYLFRDQLNRRNLNDCHSMIDIYQVAHHGSAVKTNSEDFISRINPKIAVISCGYKNSYNHPHKETIEYLEKTDGKIYRTDYEGSIKILLK